MQYVDSLNEQAGRGWGDINRGKWEGGGVEGSRVYRFWGDHRKLEYIKAPAGSDYFCFCDLQGKY